jgi:signal transduction histidine kinase
MNLFQSGIRKQLLLLILLILIPISAHLWYTGYTLRQQALAYAELQVSQSIRIFSDRQQRFIEETRYMLAVMSHLPDIGQVKGSECSAALSLMHEKNPNYSTMIVSDSDGIIDCCSLPLSGPLVIKDREWFKRAEQTKEFVVGNFIISRTSGKASLPFAYPVTDTEGKLRYVIGAALNLEAYDPLFTEFSLPAGSEFIITDRKGTILYSATTSNLPLAGKPIETFKGMTIPEDDQPALDTLLSENGQRMYWRRHITVGQDTNDIFIFVGILKETIFAQAYKLLALQALVLLAVFIITSVVAWYFGERLIATPIRILIEKTRRIGSGNFEDQRKNTRLPGDFGILADSFASMTHQIQERESERNAALQALSDSEKRYRALFEQSPISLWEEDMSALKTHLRNLSNSGITDMRKYFSEDPNRIGECLKLVQVIHVNKATIDLYEATSEEELLGSVDRIIPQRSQLLLLEQLVAVAEGRPFALEGENCTLSGKIIPVLINSSLPAGFEESWARVFLSVFDLTERYRIESHRTKLEQQLASAQKLETIGTLAGGIAHDFNNILSPIIGYSELILNSDKLSQETITHLNRILLAARRAKEMVHQILTFSRKHETHKHAVDMKALTRETMDLIRSSTSQDIDLHLEVDDNLLPVRGDAARIHQILMNLCTNAAHAMKQDRGTITVRVRNSPLVYDGHEVRKKPHVLLSVEDTGTGIDKALLGRIFDPFFTTKSPGEGSGMGLAVVHGIVNDHDGTMEVVSAPGEGTTFKVYLPCSLESIKITEKKSTHVPLPGGSEHIMVIDDEEQLVTMMSAILQNLGYTVRTYTSAIDAIADFKVNPQGIDLLITDQTMPHLTGIETSRVFLALRPDLPIILYTGFSETVSAREATQAGIQKFLYKPISRSQLATAIREVLET